MVRVKKGNRVIKIDEKALAAYLKNGYDQIDEKGNVLKKATGGRMVTLAEHNKVVAENEALRKKIEEFQTEFKNLDPKKVKELEKENEKLKKKLAELEQAQKQQEGTNTSKEA